MGHVGSTHRHDHTQSCFRSVATRENVEVGASDVLYVGAIVQSQRLLPGRFRRRSVFCARRFSLRLGSGRYARIILDGSGRTASCFPGHLCFLGQTVFKRWLRVDAQGRRRLKCFGRRVWSVVALNKVEWRLQPGDGLGCEPRIGLVKKAMRYAQARDDSMILARCVREDSHSNTT